MHIIRQISTKFGGVFDIKYSPKSKKITGVRLFLECENGLSDIPFDMNSTLVKEMIDLAQQMIDDM